MFHDLLLDSPKLRSTTIFWTVQYYDTHVVHWTIVQMDDLKLRLTGGPLDHRPNGRSQFTYHMWSIEPSSILTVKFCKFGQSKLRHLDQGAFLQKLSSLITMYVGLSVKNLINNE